MYIRLAYFKMFVFCYFFLNIYLYMFDKNKLTYLLTLLTLCVLMVLYMRQSSANNLISEFTDSGRSFIKNKKHKGPSTVPCGKP